MNYTWKISASHRASSTSTSTSSWSSNAGERKTCTASEPWCRRGARRVVSLRAYVSFSISSPLPSPLNVAFLAGRLECSSAGSLYSLRHCFPSFLFCVIVCFCFWFCPHIYISVYMYIHMYVCVNFLYASLLLLSRDFIESFCLCSCSCVYSCVNIFICYSPTHIQTNTHRCILIFVHIHTH